MYLTFIQAEPERIVKDNSALSRPSSGSKKLNHCNNAIPVIQKNDSPGIVSNGFINGSAIINHVNGHAEVGEERDTVNRRGRSRERHSSGIQRGEDSHFNCIFVSIIVVHSYRTTDKILILILIWEDKSLS